MGTRTERPRIVAYLDQELRDRVEAFAAGRSLSVSTLTLLALREYLDRHEARRRRKKS